ncbi:MAG: preprotein translocase subunit SecD [Flavobacteriales bacterium]|jgi:preprotein translocase subunit SecD
MNRYPLWKYLLVLVVVAIGGLYALPNIYEPDPAIQISIASTGVTIEDKVLHDAKAELDSLGIEYFGEEITNNSILIRIKDKDKQMLAHRKVDEALGNNYIVAVNLAPTTPEWLQSIGGKPMSKGLDLAGGVHFLLEVDTDKVVKDSLIDLDRALKFAVRENKLRGVTIRTSGDQMRISASSVELRDKVAKIIRDDMVELAIRESEEEGRFILNAELTEAFIKEKQDNAVGQNLITLRRRVNEIGVAEPLVQRQGRNRIVVQLPGIQDSSRAKKILGKTANLEFRMEALDTASLAEKEQYPSEDYGNVTLERTPIVTGRNVLTASPTFDPQTSEPQVSIQLDSDGAKRMSRGTRHNIGRKMGVLFIEYHPEKRMVKDADGNDVEKTFQVPTKEVINLATVRDALGKSFVISGLSSQAYASELALLLRAGSLAAPMTYVEERTIGPSLGEENIKKGILSVQIGLGVVLLFMLFYYRVFGLAANIALGANLVLMLAVMSILGATLTLPGIAGIVLTVGMAVDANVLIFSRIREELANGLPNQSAISAGFDRAFVTILDANITTLIVAVILYAIGSGSVKGFAVTLSIGILTSMFTAIMGTRALVNMVYGGRSVKKLWI